MNGCLVLEGGIEAVIIIGFGDFRERRLLKLL